MAPQEFPPKPDPEAIDPANTPAAASTSAAAAAAPAKDASAKNHRPRKAPHKAGSKSSRSRRKTDPEVWVKFLETVVEALALYYETGVTVIGHLVTGVIPESPAKGIPFVGVLAVLVFILGIKDVKREQLCFGCFFVLSVIAICLVIIAVKTPGTDARLREMQDERVRAIKVKPLQY